MRGTRRRPRKGDGDKRSQQHGGAQKIQSDDGAKMRTLGHVDMRAPALRHVCECAAAQRAACGVDILLNWKAVRRFLEPPRVLRPARAPPPPPPLSGTVKRLSHRASCCSQPRMLPSSRTVVALRAL